MTDHIAIDDDLALADGLCVSLAALVKKCERRIESDQQVIAVLQRQLADAQDKLAAERGLLAAREGKFATAYAARRRIAAGETSAEAAAPPSQPQEHEADGTTFTPLPAPDAGDAPQQELEPSA